MWPKELRTLFADMWVQNYTKRPSFEQILPRLKDIRGKIPLSPSPSPITKEGATLTGPLVHPMLALPWPNSGSI